jgi:hypothetical protein
MEGTGRHKQQLVESASEDALLCTGLHDVDSGARARDELQDRQWQPAEKELKQRRLVGSWETRAAESLGTLTRDHVVCRTEGRLNVRRRPAIDLFVVANRERGRTVLCLIEKIQEVPMRTAFFLFNLNF